MYQEFKPHPLLETSVECFWVISSNDVASNYRLILPDGCTDIIFNFGEPVISKSGNDYSRNSMKGFIVGNMTQPLYSKSMANHNLLGIRFKAGGLYSYLREPLDQFTDSVTDLINFKCFNHWYEELEPLTTQQRILKLEQLLFKQRPSSTSIIISYSLVQINQHHGSIRINELAKNIGISQKQLERHYSKYVGVGPKQIARVLQFQHMVRLLHCRGEESLLQLAIDGGYSDHAHFTKAFKEFAGIAPQKFISQQHQ
jgi:AraC-like DNA-binding protein